MTDSTEDKRQGSRRGKRSVAAHMDDDLFMAFSKRVIERRTKKEHAILQAIDLWMRLTEDKTKT